MDYGTIFLLLLCIVLAVQGFYFGFIRPPRALAWLSQSTFVIMTFLLIPVILYFLWFQSGAADRLAQTGIVPHPAIGTTMGLAVGRGEQPAWLFEVQPTAENVLDFYNEPEHRKGWEISSRNESMLMLTGAKRNMQIMYMPKGRSSTIYYMISSGKDGR